MDRRGHKHQVGTSCFVTAFRVEAPPTVDPLPAHEWMAVATAHVYDAEQRPRGITSEEESIMSGAVMHTVHGRGSARSQAAALRTALEGLIFQLGARGFIDTLDVDDVAFPQK